MEKESNFWYLKEKYYKIYEHGKEIEKQFYSNMLLAVHSRTFLELSLKELTGKNEELYDLIEDYLKNKSIKGSYHRLRKKTNHIIHGEIEPILDETEKKEWINLLITLSKNLVENQEIETSIKDKFLIKTPPSTGKPNFEKITEKTFDSYSGKSMPLEVEETIYKMGESTYSREEIESMLNKLKVRYEVSLVSDFNRGRRAAIAKELSKDEKLEYLRKKAESRLPLHCYNLGNYYFKINMLEEAEKNLLIAGEAGYTEAQKKLIELYNKKGSKKEALYWNEIVYENEEKSEAKEEKKSNNGFFIKLLKKFSGSES